MTKHRSLPKLAPATARLVIVSGLIVLISGAFPLSARAHSDGTLDPTFDTDGKVTTDLGSFNDMANSIAIQSDGKIVAAGFSNDDFAVARYDTSGSLDPTFDTDGQVTTDLAYDRGNSVAIQSNGKIVVGGSSHNGTNWDFALARYNTDGSLDPLFDGDGKLTTDIAGSQNQANSIAIQSDGKIVVGGPSDGKFAVARYNTDGSLDPDFSGDGVVTTAFGGDASASSIAIQSDGKIVVGGTALVAGIRDFALARYNTDGSLDLDFDTDGKVTTAVGPFHDTVSSIAIQSDGRIVAGGQSDSSTDADAGFARYNTDGSLDPTFGTGGTFRTATPSQNSVTSIALQSDGKIVAGGFSDESFFLSRYNTDGSLDPTFDTDGMLTTGFETYAIVTSIKLQSDGKIVAGGVAGTDVGVARYASVPVLDDAPTCADDSASTDEDSQLADSVTCVDPEEGPLTYAVVTGVSDGTLVFETDGTFTYDPDPDFNGSDSFTFRASDGAGQDSDGATFDISVNPVEEPTYTLSITKNGTGTGTVTSGTGAISCDPTCDDSYGDTETVTLSAAPVPGSTFTAFSANCAPVTGEPERCTITIDSDKTVMATFTAAPIGGGGNAGPSPSPSPTGSPSPSPTGPPSPTPSPVPTEAPADVTCGGQTATIQIAAPNQTTLGTTGDDVISGTSGNDTIHSGSGNDIVCGRAGNDTIYGQDLADTLYGGRGRDKLHGGGGTGGGTFGDNLHGGAGGDRLVGDGGDDHLNGDGGGDRLYGDGGDDLLYGNAGVDSLYGDFGKDSLYGGVDSDACHGGEGVDIGWHCEPFLQD